MPFHIMGTKDQLTQWLSESWNCWTMAWWVIYPKANWSPFKSHEKWQLSHAWAECVYCITLFTGERVWMVGGLPRREVHLDWTMWGVCGRWHFVFHFGLIRRARVSVCDSCTGGGRSAGAGWWESSNWSRPARASLVIQPGIGSCTRLWSSLQTCFTSRNGTTVIWHSLNL